LYCRVRASRFILGDGGCATVVIGKVKRAYCLLTDSPIFALGSGWKLQHDLVPLATTAGEPRLADKCSVILRAGDEQFGLITDKSRHLLPIHESHGFEMSGRALVARWRGSKRD
jgi:hypothetical protein